MMEIYKNKMIELEKKYHDLTYICKNGNCPIILTAAHTMEQLKEDGNVKLGEPYTKAIALYVSEIMETFCLIKNKDTGIDSNKSKDDTFKNMLLDNIKDNNIRLVIDLHGARKDREFDIEIGTLNNLTSDYTTVNELIDSFNENGIFKVEVNEPFKGGEITKKIYGETECDILQIEINGKYRNISEIEKLKQVTDSLINFIRYYVEIINK